MTVPLGLRKHSEAFGTFQFRASGNATGMDRDDNEVNRPDDRGEELPESPAPDPEEKEHPRPDDDPQAD